MIMVLVSNIVHVDLFHIDKIFLFFGSLPCYYFKSTNCKHINIAIKSINQSSQGRVLRVARLLSPFRPILFLVVVANFIFGIKRME